MIAKYNINLVSICTSFVSARASYAITPYYPLSQPRRVLSAKNGISSYHMRIAPCVDNWIYHSVCMLPSPPYTTMQIFYATIYPRLPCLVIVVLCYYLSQASLPCDCGFMLYATIYLRLPCLVIVGVYFQIVTDRAQL
jgi:hypothetical protein